MQIHQCHDTTDAVAKSATQLAGLLSGETSLFVSGGSSFAVFTTLDSILTSEQKKRMHIMLVDERYGLVGHEQSNWNLFADTDLGSYASAHPILVDGKSLETTASDYTEVVANALSKHRCISILGIGADRHVAGIKPMAELAFHNVFDDSLVAGYEAQDFVRVTLTPNALTQIDKQIVFVAGADKQFALANIADGNPLYVAPANILQSLDGVEIYNVIGG